MAQKPFGKLKIGSVFTVDFRGTPLKLQKIRPIQARIEGDEYTFNALNTGIRGMSKEELLTLPRLNNGGFFNLRADLP